jgi:tetratricopeptide (TPR) repeat protein
MTGRVALAAMILLLCCGAVGYAYDEAYETGVRHFKGGDYRGAIPFLENYVSRKPDPAGYYMLGYAWYHLGDYGKSRAYFDQAYLIDPGFSSGNVPAHAGLSREDEKLIHDALALSGARIQMSYYADILSGSLPLVQRSMNKDQTAQDLHAVFRSAFSPDRLYPSVVGSFGRRFDRRHVVAVIQWLNSPPGKKMAAAGIAAYAPPAAVRSTASDESLGKLPGPRRQIIQKLEKVLSVADINIDIVSASLVELMKGMQSQLGERSPLNASEIDALAEGVRERMREELSSQVLLFLAQACRSLSDEEIGAAIRFYASPAGRWFLETGVYSLRRAIGHASRETGERMGKTLAFRRLAV